MVEAALLNLKAREVKPIGRIPGGWTIDTAIPHPVVAAVWISQKDAEKLPKPEPPAVKLFHHGLYVIEETDEIVK